GPATRVKVRSWEDGGKFAFCWLSSRLSYTEALLGYDEEWPMFSDLAHERRHTRARLVYAGGSDRVVRQTTQPPDLAPSSCWNQEKVYDYETKVRNEAGHAAHCQGYCNWLAHRYARNESGAALKTIVLYRVWYDLPRPGTDARAHYEEQMERIKDPPR